MGLEKRAIKSLIALMMNRSVHSTTFMRSCVPVHEKETQSRFHVYLCTRGLFISLCACANVYTSGLHFYPPSDSSCLSRNWIA